MGSISSTKLLLHTLAIYDSGNYLFSKLSWSFDFWLWLGRGAEEGEQVTEQEEWTSLKKKKKLSSCRHASASSHYFLHMRVCVM